MKGPEIPPKHAFWPGLSVLVLDFVFAPSEAVFGVAASRPWQAAGVHEKSRVGSLLRLKSGSASSRMSLAT